MYGPKWLFLLMYESHDMRHRFFHWLTGCQRTPRIWGVTEHLSSLIFQMFYKMFSRVETDVQFEHPLGNDTLPHVTTTFLKMYSFCCK